MQDPILLSVLQPNIAKVTTVRWWMGHYSAETPKRHWGAGNTPLMSKLDKGVLQGWKKKTRTTTPVVKYIDARGVQRYKGTKDLRRTEYLDANKMQIGWLFLSIIKIVKRVKSGILRILHLH